MAKELSHQNFRDFVCENRFAVVHFWARWNGYDSQMADLLEHQVPAELAATIAFGRFDVDRAEHFEICGEHGVRNVPTLALYREATLVRTITGMRPLGEIAAALQDLVV